MVSKDVGRSEVGEEMRIEAVSETGRDTNNLNK
jgi:hypothetical protein